MVDSEIVHSLKKGLRVGGGEERVDAILPNSMVALELASMKVQRVALVGMAQRTRAMLRETYETGTLGRTQR